MLDCLLAVPLQPGAAVRWQRFRELEEEMISCGVWPVHCITRGDVHRAIGTHKDLTDRQADGVLRAASEHAWPWVETLTEIAERELGA